MENQEKLVLSQNKIQRKPKGYTLNPEIIQGQENNALFRAVLQTQDHGKSGALKSGIKGYSPHGLTVALSGAGPEERPLLESTEATAGADAVGVAEEAGEDGSRSPDSMSATEGNAKN